METTIDETVAKAIPPSRAPERASADHAGTGAADAGSALEGAAAQT